MNPTRAFTLIELLVVISIIALLISLLLPVLSQAKWVALKTENMTNMKAWAGGTSAYANDHDQFFPYNGTNKDLLIHGEAYPGAGVRPGAETSWCSTDVQYMWKNYMMPNYTSAKRGDKNVLYNPTQEHHRFHDQSLIGGLIGYFYWPRRVPGTITHIPQTRGYASKERFDEGPDPTSGGKPRFEMPILQDQIQVRSAGNVWIAPQGHPFSSWARAGGVSEGGHSLYEDGRVWWDTLEELDVGAMNFMWHYYFKVVQ